MLDRFWLKMAEMFGHAWVSQYGATPSTGSAWGIALGGLTGEQIANGLRATLMLGKDWPPSTGRFRSLCLGIPEFAAVRMDLRRQHRQRMRFTLLVWSLLDSHGYLNASGERAERMLRDAYEEAHGFIMQGGELPPAPVAEIAAEPPVPPVPNREAVAKAINDLAAMTGAPVIVSGLADVGQQSIDDSDADDAAAAA